VLITILVLVTFAATPLVLFAARVGGAAATAILPAALFAGFATLLPEVIAGNVIVENHAWIPSLGISLSFRVDGLSLLFALLITGIGSCVFLYAASYLANRPDRPTFFAYLNLFMGAMLGAVLADNLVAMLVFWELTSLTSFLLIGFEHEKPQARRYAQQGLLVTVAGGLALTAGVILLGNAAGSYQVSDIVSQGTVIATKPSTVAIIALIALGAFTKSAQTPFHFWLPNAMVAPTPVSAYLHSATMVKLGVYLLARLKPVYGEHDLWIALLLTVGSATMLTGAVLALRETDLKRILACSTLVALGMLVSLIGLPHELAAVAMATFLIVHALYKACLFLVAGMIDHETGTRDGAQLSGLGRKMPVTAAIAMLGGLSMAGLPPLIGFIGKELVYEAALIAPIPWLAAGIAVIANAVTVVAAAIVAVRCFFGPVVSTPKPPHDPPIAMLLGPGVLALLGVVFGMVPWHIQGLVDKVAETVTGEATTVHLALWHGFTSMLILSLVTLALGVLVFVSWNALRSWLGSRTEIDQFGPNAAYDRLMLELVRFATWQTQLIQSGRLHTYLAAMLVTAAVGVATGLVMFSGFSLPQVFWADIQPIIVLPVLLILASLAVVRAGSFMAGIVAAGMVGFLMSLVYLFQGAPDLAFTQFSVEALSIVILLTIVGRMPFHETGYRTLAERRRDVVVAISFGTIAALVLLAVVAAPFDDRLSEYYKFASVAEAHGHNEVNVIIVDFRGLDTLGEITVLTLAAIAASALIAKTPLRKRFTAAVEAERKEEA
jgi:multicomponent Na+:H+ antiporter subunit A